MGGAPVARTPVLDDRTSQLEVLFSAQSSELEPVFDNEKPVNAGVNGPLTGPLAARSELGVIRNASDGARSALIELLPFGVPQPVQRS